MSTRNYPLNTGRYAVKSYREAGGEETVCFDAQLTLDGKVVASVRNSGTGGEHIFRFAPGADEQAFYAHAQSQIDEEYLAVDEFFDYLINVSILNKSRCVSFLLDDEDYFGNGRYSRFGSKVSFEDAVLLLKHQHAAQNPRIWVKDKSAFVAVTDLPA